MTDSGGTDGSTSRRRRLDAVAFGLAVLIASVVPIPATAGGSAATVFPLGIGLTDPFHFVGYAVLAALLVRTTGRNPRGALVAVGGAAAVGFGVELVQATIPWRSFAWDDIAVNAAGAVVGVAVAVTAVVAVAAVRDRRLRS